MTTEPSLWLPWQRAYARELSVAVNAPAESSLFCLTKRITADLKIGHSCAVQQPIGFVYGNTEMRSRRQKLSTVILHTCPTISTQH